MFKKHTVLARGLHGNDTGLRVCAHHVRHEHEVHLRGPANIRVLEVVRCGAIHVPVGV